MEIKDPLTAKESLKRVQVLTRIKDTYHKEKYFRPLRFEDAELGNSRKSNENHYVAEMRPSEAMGFL